ncbi:MAG: Ku protein [Myxococcales bacterium]|nr:Ku protein [Myxococcales bacterium]
MARPIWSGSISFGLVSVPVKLFSATSPKEVRFHMLHDKDGARIQQKRVCSADGKEVPWEHIVKGFEISKGRYVTVTREELESFNPRATKAIEIEDFVDLEQIDPIYYETTYYLVPDKGASKPYALLVEAMRKTGKVGVARFVLRTKQYLCAVRPLGKALAVSTMLYADEVVSQDELDGLPDSKPGERELKMAEQLIGSLEADFDVKKYKDDYREQVLALLERKAEGEEIVAAEPAEAPRGKVVNLMDALQKSLAAAKKGELREAQEAPARGEVRHKPHAHHRAAARTARKRKSK